MSDREALVRDVYRTLPADKRDTLARAAKAGNMSIGAAIAMSLAQGPIREFCPPDERAKVAGLLMRVFLDAEVAS